MDTKRIKQKYEIRGKPTEFEGFSFTVSAKKNLRRRDVRRMLAKFLVSLGIEGIACLIASDGANGNSFHFVLNRNLSKFQSKLLEAYIEKYRKIHGLGDEKYFYVPDIKNTFDYVTAHKFLDILRITECQTAA